MYHNYSRSQRFQKLLFQDVLRFQKMIFRNVLRFQDASKKCPNIFKKYPRCCKHISELLGFTEISRSSKMFPDLKDLSRFHHVDVPFSTIVNTNCVGPTIMLIQFVRPHNFQALTVNTFRHPPFAIKSTCLISKYPPAPL